MSETLVRQTAYRTVHLPQGQDYGFAKIGGLKVPVTEEYLNSKETRSYLELNRKRFHKSTLNFLESVDNLDRIEESKVYLCITDDKGEPLYRTWESFLKAVTSLERSMVCKMRAARDGYRWLKKTHEGKEDGMLALLPCNMNFYDAPIGGRLHVARGKAAHAVKDADVRRPSVTTQIFQLCRVTRVARWLCFAFSDLSM